MTISCSWLGLTPTYGLLLEGPAGRRQWILVAGLTGETLEPETEDDVRAVLAAMEECLDQDVEVLCPAERDATCVSRAAGTSRMAGMMPMGSPSPSTWSRNAFSACVRPSIVRAVSAAVETVPVVGLKESPHSPGTPSRRGR